MNDEFFREVDEEYRRDKVAEIWKKHQNLIICVMALIVLGVGGYNYWEGVQRNKAQLAGTQFSAALAHIQSGNDAEAEKLLVPLAKEADGGYAALSKLMLAGDRTRKDKDAAKRDYAALANDATLTPEWRDFAKLRAAILRMDDAETETAKRDFEALAVAGGTWRHTAREMLGLMSLQRNDYPAAQTWFTQIDQDAETPAALRNRLRLYLAVTAGGPVQATK